MPRATFPACSLRLTTQCATPNTPAGRTALSNSGGVNARPPAGALRRPTRGC